MSIKLIRIPIIISENNLGIQHADRVHTGALLWEPAGPHTVPSVGRHVRVLLHIRKAPGEALLRVRVLDRAAEGGARGACRYDHSVAKHAGRECKYGRSFYLWADEGSSG